MAPGTRSLDCLPIEVVQLVIHHLSCWETKQLSQVNRRLRSICIPFVFRCVRFEFSRNSLRDLKDLFTSELRHHVLSFTYVAPELLKDGMLPHGTGRKFELTRSIDVVNFDHFKSSILTPDNYVDEAKTLYDYGHPPEFYPPYVAIFTALQKIYRKQNHIIESGMDQAALTLAFRAFSRMKELTVHFCTTIERKDWLEYYMNLDMTMPLKSYEHHVRVLSNALSYARSRGSLVDTVHLSGFQIPRSQYDIADLMSLSSHLRELLSGVFCFKMTQSESSLDLLSRCPLNIVQFDMCYMTVDYRTLRRFLDENRVPLRSIGVHNVLIANVPFHNEELPYLDIELLRALVNARGGSQTHEMQCSCLPHRKGWRLLLPDRSAEESGDQST